MLAYLGSMKVYIMLTGAILAVSLNGKSSLEQFIGDFTQRFKSFSRCNEWISSSEKAVLENSLFYIVVEDNEWSIAIKLIQKEQGYHFSGNIENLQSETLHNIFKWLERLFIQAI